MDYVLIRYVNPVNLAKREVAFRQMSDLPLIATVKMNHIRSPLNLALIDKYSEHLWISNATELQLLASLSLLAEAVVICSLEISG